MDIMDFKNAKKFSEGSGVVPAVDDNVYMALNQLGIYEEEVNDNNRFNSDLFEAVSPNFNETYNESIIGEKLYSQVSGIKQNDYLGYYLETYIGYVAEGDYRKNASSGGIGTWLFTELLKENHIDGVIHVKENQDKSSDILFKYDISRTVEEILEGAKTRYYPVEMSEVLQIVKENPGRYAVIGIPSFIYAIRLLQEYDPVFKERIVYTVGLLCGHQKSAKFAEYMGWQVGIKPGDLESIDFRYKLPNRSAGNYGIKMTGKVNGEHQTIIRANNELFAQNWGHGMFKVFASDYIDDVMNETADITLGDAWISPYIQDPKGNNVAIVRHPFIQQLLEKAIDEGRLSLKKVDEQIIIDSQAAHFRHNRDELKYRLHKKDKNNEWRPQKRVDSNHKVSPIRQEIQDMREKISSESHTLYLEAVKRNDIRYFEKEMSKMLVSYDALYVKYYLKQGKIKRALYQIYAAIKRKIQFR